MKLKVLRKMNNTAMCVACGMTNDFSLKTQFYAVEGDLAVGLVTGRDEHQSYPGRMHGGLITALLDEVVGHAINVPEPDTFGVTSEINVKFKKPVPLNEPLTVVGKLTRNTRLLFQAEGFIEDQAGTILATGTATYIKLPIERIAGRSLTPDQWFLLPDDVQEIEVINVDYFNKDDE